VDGIRVAILDLLKVGGGIFILPRFFPTPTPSNPMPQFLRRMLKLPPFQQAKLHTNCRQGHIYLVAVGSPSQVAVR